MLHPSVHAGRTPDKPAYVMAGSGEALSYRALDDASNRGAQALRSLGIEPGDHIALLMENSLDFMTVAWAAHRAGVVYTAISRYLGADEAGYILRDCGAKALIVSPDDGPRARALVAEAPGTALFMVGGAADGIGSWDALCARQPATPVADACAGEDLLYSSGTTGRPKGIARGWEKRALDWVLPIMPILCDGMCAMDADMVYLSPAPLYHAAPLRFAMRAASLGATTIIMEKFDAEAFLAAVQTHRVTHSQLVPTHFVRMLKLPATTRARYDLSSLRVAVHAAAPCPAQVKRAMIDWWGPIILEYYAGTEANGLTVATCAEWLAHPGTVGRSLVGAIRIVDAAGRDLPVGDTGAVYFDSGIDFAYRGDASKTAAAFLAPGCSTLGDVGYLDADGFLHLTDRAAYTIISGGVNIYPQEAEDLLISHPDVIDAAVFGIPHDDLGEAVHAVVQLRAPGAVTAYALTAWLRARLSPIKTPRSIEFRSDLPRTATGKLMKRKLKDEFAR
jgi:long-chain acyl-CoA synthetase